MGTEPNVRKPLEITATFVGSAAGLFTFFSWFSFIRGVGNSLSQSGARWSELIPYQDPMFVKDFWQGLELYLSRPSLILLWMTQESIGNVFIACLVGLALYWGFVWPSGVRSYFYWLPALTPFVLSLGLYPQAVLQGFQSLAEAGLSHPGAIGGLIGETTYYILAGLLASIASVGIAVKLSPRKEALPE